MSGNNFLWMYILHCSGLRRTCLTYTGLRYILLLLGENNDAIVGAGNVYIEMPEWLVVSTVRHKKDDTKLHVWGEIVLPECFRSISSFRCSTVLKSNIFVKCMDLIHTSFDNISIYLECQVACIWCTEWIWTGRHAKEASSSYQQISDLNTRCSGHPIHLIL